MVSEYRIVSNELKSDGGYVATRPISIFPTLTTVAAAPPEAAHPTPPALGCHTGPV
jgi:hypothetical protein